MEIRGPRIWDGRPVTDQQAETILNAVLDAGINFIDTANDYGRSEEFIGKYIAHVARNFTSLQNVAVPWFARMRTAMTRRTFGHATICFAA